jgi:hypothetical protein
MASMRKEMASLQKENKNLKECHEVSSNFRCE